MSDPIADNPIIQRMEVLLAEIKEREESCREMLREVHSTSKAINTTVSYAAKVVEDLEAKCEDIVKATYGDIISKGLDNYVDEMRMCVELGREHILKYFDDFTRVLMSGNSRGRPREEGFDLLNLPGATFTPMHNADRMQELKNLIAQSQRTRMANAVNPTSRTRTSGQRTSSPKKRKRR